MIRKILLVAVLSIGGGAGCSAESAEESGDLSAAGASEVVPGPLVRKTTAEVWSVENQWADKDTENAKKSGIAWSEDSGLTCNQKGVAEDELGARVAKMCR